MKDRLPFNYLLCPFKLWDGNFKRSLFDTVSLLLCIEIFYFMPRKSMRVTWGHWQMNNLAKQVF